uniref:Secreted protein n=1 Tax=Cacopsylla melanoneura TaxID=428564 RepID=A0A8D9B4F0_9HEMI
MVLVRKIVAIFLRVLLIAALPDNTVDAVLCHCLHNFPAQWSSICRYCRTRLQVIATGHVGDNERTVGICPGVALEAFQTDDSHDIELGQNKTTDHSLIERHHFDNIKKEVGT